ncbi:hypothetical protein EFBL_0136 [Effusibacillus lacus]|uniref:Calcineurin-like phosphoesterase domain-containing protein n=1 Tax=Effusibacillus lacus TaxID=1348429 RepID=A0A292YF79_9BACL|nr:hypothetical protein EFBL_0136 [Effusibacillus lacus]
MHLGTWGSFERVKKAAMMLADLSSDLVIVAGDLTSKPEAEPLIDEVLSPIGEAYGVLGNWDYRYPPTSRLQSKIKLL